MPIIGYKTKDGQKWSKDYYRFINPDKLPQAYLGYLEAHERLFDGIPHVTQLITGLRESYLKITEGYYVDPLKFTAIFLGLGVHSLLETPGKSILWQGIQGKPDLIEDDCLWDFKVWGSYRVKSAQSGNLENETLQLNCYRLIVEDKILGATINELKILSFVRDSGVAIAKGRGIDKEIYTFPVEIIPRSEIEGFFFERRDILLHYLNEGEMPPVCSGEECWGGKKCQDWCEVSEF